MDETRNRRLESDDFCHRRNLSDPTGASLLEVSTRKISLIIMWFQLAIRANTKESDLRR